MFIMSEKKCETWNKVYPMGKIIQLQIASKTIIIF